MMDSPDFYLYVFIGIGVILLVLLIPYVFFLINLQKTLASISPENRKVEPGSVWLMFIPLFNLVWQFILVDRISDSIAAECNRLNIPLEERRPTYNIGLAYCILSIAGGFIPVVGFLAAIVCFIIYWVKTAAYRNLIIANKENFMLDAERDVFHTIQ